MNETARFGDKCFDPGRFCDAQLSAMRRFCPRRNHDKPDGGIRNCRRRYTAGLLRADDAFAEPARNSERATQQLLALWGNYTADEGWIISSRLGGDNPAFDSSGNPSDPGGGDSGGGADGGGGSGD